MIVPITFRCAFQNTPKFNQVKSKGGCIIRKEWIIDCFSKKQKLPAAKWVTWLTCDYTFLSCAYTDTEHVKLCWLRSSICSLELSGQQCCRHCMLVYMSSSQPAILFWRRSWNNVSDWPCATHKVVVGCCVHVSSRRLGVIFSGDIGWSYMFYRSYRLMYVYTVRATDIRSVVYCSIHDFPWVLYCIM